MQIKVIKQITRYHREQVTRYYILVTELRFFDHWGHHILLEMGEHVLGTIFPD